MCWNLDFNLDSTDNIFSLIWLSLDDAYANVCSWTLMLEFDFVFTDKWPIVYTPENSQYDSSILFASVLDMLDLFRMT